MTPRIRKNLIRVAGVIAILFMFAFVAGCIHVIVVAIQTILAY